MAKLYRERVRHTPATHAGRVDDQPQSVHDAEDRWSEAAARWRWHGDRPLAVRSGRALRQQEDSEGIVG